MNNHKYLSLWFLLLICTFLTGHESQGQDLAILKYEGGGDWYANPTALPNLINFCNQNIETAMAPKPKSVDIKSRELFDYPIVFMTGHGNVFFSEEASKNLRKYLMSGGFLHISDNYGLEKFIRQEMKKVFPEQEFQLVPSEHEIYHQSYNFERLPKIHEHDGKPAEGLGIFVDGRLVCFFDYESDLSDGWEDPEVHKDPEEVRQKALKMGANIIEYAFKN